MRSKLLPKRDSSPDSLEANRFKVQGTGFKFKSHGTHSSRRCLPTSSGIGPKPKGRRKNETGFTLIEVIVALIIVSVMAAMIFHTTGGGLWRTARGIGECRVMFELQNEMERIVGIYKRELRNGSGNIDLTAFLDAVDDDPEIDYVDTDQTGYLMESDGAFSLVPSPTPLLLVILAQDDQRIANIFAGN